MTDGTSDHANEGDRPADKPARGDLAEDLHATSESIRTDSRRLAEVEAAKLELDPGDPRVDDLSDRAVELADRIAVKTRVERSLSQEAT
jgi:hypothetical protein